MVVVGGWGGSERQQGGSPAGCWGSWSNEKARRSLGKLKWRRDLKTGRHGVRSLGKQLTGAGDAEEHGEGKAT